MAPRSSYVNHESRKRIQTSASDIPKEIWDQILSKLDQRHFQSTSLVSKLFLSITNLHKKTLIISDPIMSPIVPSLFYRFPNIKNLSDFSGHPLPALAQLSRFNYRLQSLHLYFCERLSLFNALQRLPVSTLSGVTSLKFHFAKSAASSDDLLMIAESFPCLDELDLTYSCDYDSDDDDDDSDDDNDDDSDDDYHDAISVLTSKLNGLRRIKFEGNEKISDKALILLSKNCPKLEGISVKNCAKVTRTGINFVLQACKNLNMFRLAPRCHTPVDGYDEPLCGALSLSEIDFACVSVSDDLLLALAKAHLPLKSFALHSCYGFTYDGILSFLMSYNSLNHLALTRVDFLSDKAMITLAKSLTEVRSVNLNGCQNLLDSTLHTLIKQCHLLKTIEMRDTGIGNEKGFRGSNAFNPTIVTLDLSWSCRLSNESLKKIALACPNLRTLRLGYCLGISAEGVGEILRNCPGLKHLDITSCDKVESLHLADTKTHQLEFLEACSMGFKDKALIEISKKCPDLMFLNVRCCDGLTSEGVGEVVDKCTKLKEIDFDGCGNMSQDIVDGMIPSRPSLRKIVPSRSHGRFECRRREPLFKK